MTTFEHQPHCDGAHTTRQPCNTRAGRTQPAAPTTPVAVPPDAPDERPVTAAWGEEPYSAGGDARGGQMPTSNPREAPPTLDAQAGDLSTPTPSPAIADGPLDPVDTGGFPILALIGTAAAMAAILLVAARLLRRRPRG